LFADCIRSRRGVSLFPALFFPHSEPLEKTFFLYSGGYVGVPPHTCCGRFFFTPGFFTCEPMLARTPRPPSSPFSFFFPYPWLPFRLCYFWGSTFRPVLPAPLSSRFIVSTSSRHFFFFRIIGGGLTSTPSDVFLSTRSPLLVGPDLNLELPVAIRQSTSNKRSSGF